ncbi:MAG: spermidine/putrescine transporter permease [Paenibacillus sp.]|jgi:ABC-type sugar transport system permease subunit|nr:spermidine/putrescine transporter permease [Paenibacillus sp.]
MATNIAKPIKRKGIKGEGAPGYAFIAVALVVFAMFTAYPVVSAFIISLQEYKPLGSTYVGFDNYVSTVKDALFLASNAQYRRLYAFDSTCQLVIVHGDRDYDSAA